MNVWIIMSKYTFGDAPVAVYTNRDGAYKYLEYLKKSDIADIGGDQSYWIECAPLVSD